MGWSIWSLSVWLFVLVVAAMVTAHQITLWLVRRRAQKVQLAIIAAIENQTSNEMDDLARVTAEEDEAIAEEMANSFPPERPN